MVNHTPIRRSDHTDKTALRGKPKPHIDPMMATLKRADKAIAQFTALVSPQLPTHLLPQMPEYKGEKK